MNREEDYIVVIPFYRKMASHYEEINKRREPDIVVR